MAATTFQEVTHILHRWDKGGVTVREQILKDFISQCHLMTAPQLEEQFNNCASLFLARVTSWMRISYMFGTCLQLQLQTIQIFVSASTGFLTEFLEVGGVLSLLEIMGLRTSKEKDKKAAILLLTAVVSHGRQYKEMVCESYGVKITGECLALSASEDTQECAQHLLHQLFLGNPRYQGQIYKALVTLLSAPSPQAQQLATYTLKLVQPMMTTVSSALVEPLLNLLKSLYMFVQHEAEEFIRQLLLYEEIKQPLLVGLIGLLKPEDIHKSSADISSGKALPAHIQQAAAARIVCDVASDNAELADKMMEMNIVPYLLFSMSNTSYYDSQRRSAKALEVFVRGYASARSVVEEVMGPQLFSGFMSSPENVCSSLTLDQIDSLAKSFTLTQS